MKFYTNIDLNNNELQNAKVHNLTSAPLNAQKGLIYFDTTENKYFGYNGTEWVDLGYKHPSKHAIGEITGLQDALDQKANVSHNHAQYENQNSFSSVKVGLETISSANATDTFELAAGTNVQLTADTSQKKVTIALDGETVTSSEKQKWNAKETTEGSQQKADAALEQAKSYADTKVAELVNGAPQQLDTLKELADAISGNQAGVSDLLSKIGQKADTTYVDGQLDTKADSVHTHTGDQVTLTGYTKAGSASPISQSDSVLVALGKVEKALDEKQAAGNYAAKSHDHSGVYEPVISKNTAFNKNFGTGADEVAQGNHNHDGVYSPVNHSHNNMSTKFATNIGDGSTSSITVQHNLNTEDVVVSVRETASKQMIMVDAQVVDANNIRIVFAVPPALNAFRVTVIG